MWSLGVLRGAFDHGRGDGDGSLLRRPKRLVNVLVRRTGQRAPASLATAREPGGEAPMAFAGMRAPAPAARLRRTPARARTRRRSPGGARPRRSRGRRARRPSAPSALRAGSRTSAERVLDRLPRSPARSASVARELRHVRPAASPMRVRSSWSSTSRPRTAGELVGVRAGRGRRAATSVVGRRRGRCRSRSRPWVRPACIARASEPLTSPRCGKRRSTATSARAEPPAELVVAHVRGERDPLPEAAASDPARRRSPRSDDRPAQGARPGPAAHGREQRVQRLASFRSPGATDHRRAPRAASGARNARRDRRARSHVRLRLHDRVRHHEDRGAAAELLQVAPAELAVHDHAARAAQRRGRTTASAAVRFARVVRAHARRAGVRPRARRRTRGDRRRPSCPARSRPAPDRAARSDPGAWHANRYRSRWNRTLLPSEYTPSRYHGTSPSCFGSGSATRRPCGAARRSRSAAARPAPPASTSRRRSARAAAARRTRAADASVRPRPGAAGSA